MKNIKLVINIVITILSCILLPLSAKKLQTRDTTLEKPSKAIRQRKVNPWDVMRKRKAEKERNANAIRAVPVPEPEIYQAIEPDKNDSMSEQNETAEEQEGIN